MERIIEPHVYSWLNIGGRQVAFITDAVVVTWIVMAAIVIITLVLTRRLETIPRGGQKVAEAVVSLINSMCETQIGCRWRPFAPWLGAVLIFLCFSNLVAIFNIIPSGETLAALFHNPALAGFSFGLHPPTRNFNVTLCLALSSIFIVIGAEFRYMGVRGWLRSLYRPIPVISTFIKILDYVVRPMSLCLRLFGNILGGFIVMTLLYMAMPFLAPAVIGVYFDLFDGALQAYVFVFLTMLYIAEAVEHGGEAA